MVHGRGRKAILVFHGGENNILFLEGLKIDLCPLYAIDTQGAAQSAFSLDYSCSLKELLKRLECEFALLHVAGNDATYTLKALLLLASLEFPDHSHLCPAQRALFLISGEITKAPPSLEWLVRQKDPEKMAIRRQNKKITLMAKRERQRTRKEERKRKSDTNDQRGTDEDGPSVVSTATETKD